MLKHSLLGVFSCILLFCGSVYSQSARLHSYARFELGGTIGNRLVDTGRFTYSGGRGLRQDSSTDFPFLFSRPDYSYLNAWYNHPHKIVAPQNVAQFDSLFTWRWDDSLGSIQPFRAVIQFHTGQRLDSLVDSRINQPSISYKWQYNTANQPTQCREWLYSSSSSQWVRSGGINLIRNVLGQPQVAEIGQYDTSGALTGIVTNYYQYDTNGRLQIVTISVGSGVRELFSYDTLGRLLTWSGQELDSSNTWNSILIDSFRYEGNSNRCSHIYNYTSNFIGGMTLTNHHTYTYDANSSLIGYGSYTVNMTIFRNAQSLPYRTTEIVSGGRMFETFFYYDSLGSADVRRDMMLSSAAVYPNPAQERIYVRASFPALSYKIYSITGTEMLHGAFENGEKSLSIATLPSGMYLISLQFQDGKAEVVKFLKR